MQRKHMQASIKVLLIAVLAIGWFSTSFVHVAPTYAQSGDRDGDGVGDSRDDCPSVAGPASNMGCPERAGSSDSDDGDGDGETATPTNEIPPDTDGDGTADGLDRCPNTPGDGANGGCPEGQTSDDPTRADAEPEPETSADPAPIALVPMPTTGPCVASPVGANGVNMRSSWSIDAAVVDVLQVNEMREVWAVVNTDDEQYPTWYLLPWGYVNSTVVRLGGECAWNTDSLAAVDLVAIGNAVNTGVLDILCPEGEDGESGLCADPDNLEMMTLPVQDILWCPEYDSDPGAPNECIEISLAQSVPHTGILDILCPENEDGQSDPCAEPDNPTMFPTHELDLLWCPDYDSDPGAPDNCVEISLSGSLSQLSALDILCPEGEDGQSGACVESDNPTAAQLPGQLDILWCWEDVADPDSDDNCAEYSLVSLVPQLGILDILCPEGEDGESGACVEPDNPAMMPAQQLDILYCPNVDSDPGAPDDCVEISLSGALPQMGQMDYLCPPSEDGEETPCIELDIPTALPAQPLDILWCPDDVTEPTVDGDCFELYTQTVPLVGQLDILCPVDENGESGSCVQVNPALGTLEQLDILWCWEDVADPNEGACPTLP